MTSNVGKREAHKIATRQSIQAAADDLFEANGYAGTTVRDIADSAGVTERTFFRYFSGKEELLVKDIEQSLPLVGDEIRRRPPDEPPLDAVENAFLVLHDALDGADSKLAWLFHDGPPGPRLEKSRPGLLLKIEERISDALVDRARRLEDGDVDVFRYQVIARAAVAAIRSAGIRRWELRDASSGSEGEVALTRRAFAIMREGWGA